MPMLNSLVRVLAKPLPPIISPAENNTPGTKAA